MPSDFNNLGRLAKQIETGAAIAREATTDEVASLVRASYRDSEHGQVHVHSDGSGVYTASARGEAPARDSGELEKHTEGMEIDDETSAVIADTDYAEELEQEGGRPILQPFAEETKVILYQNLAEQLSKTG